MEPESLSARDELERAILGEGAAFTALEVAEETGVTIDQLRRLWRALGFPEHGLEVAFTRADVGAVSTLIGIVESDLIDFDLAVNLTRAVGQTMARLADWEVATLVHRVEELEQGTTATGSRTGSAMRMVEQMNPPFEELAHLRLAPPPRRGRVADRGPRRERGGPAHHPGDGRLRRHRQLHGALEPDRAGPDRRPGRGLRVPLRRRRGGQARAG